MPVLSPLLANTTEHLQCLQTPEACRGAFPIYLLSLSLSLSMPFFLSELIFNVFFLDGTPVGTSSPPSCGKWNPFLEWLSRQRGFGRAQDQVGLSRMRMTNSGGTQCTLECGHICVLNRVYKRGVQTKLAPILKHFYRKKKKKRKVSIF